jgi:hypothetical protein
MSRPVVAEAPRILVSDLIYGAIAACAIGFIAYITLFKIGLAETSRRVTAVAELEVIPAEGGSGVMELMP